LDQVRLQRVLHDHGHRAGDLQHLRRHRLTVIRRRNDNASEPAAQIGQAARQSEDGHHFRRRGDDELALARHAVRLAAQADHGVTQLAIVHVERARPDDG
jgi:hypothetical protein